MTRMIRVIRVRICESESTSVPGASEREDVKRPALFFFMELFRPLVCAWIHETVLLLHQPGNLGRRWYGGSFHRRVGCHLAVSERRLIEGANLRTPLPCRILQLIMRHDPVDETGLHGFLCVPVFPGQDQLEGELILTGKNWDAKKSMEAGLINRIVPHNELQDAAWQWGAEIGAFDKTTLRYCKMAAHASMEAATVPAAAEIAWLMQEEHALVNPRAYAGTKPFHK